MGRKSCMVRQCRSLRPAAGEVVTVHRFPACPIKRHSWKSFVEQCNGISLDGVSWMNCYLCSRHFHPNSLTKPGPGRRVRPGHNPRLVLTPSGMLREILPVHTNPPPSNQMKEYRLSTRDIVESAQNASNLDHAEAESIWCHPLLEGMDCSENEETTEKPEMDQCVAAENEELKEKLRATELVFDTCHRSLKEKETIIQDLREMVKMKQRKIKRLEERIAQLESNQDFKAEFTKGILEAATSGFSELFHPSAMMGGGQGGGGEDCGGAHSSSTHAQMMMCPPALVAGENEPHVLEFLNKLCSTSPRYQDLVLSALNTCLPQHASVPMVAARNDNDFSHRTGMRKWYAQLHEINRTLITQHQIRCTTNENVMESIKTVNQIVQKAARLRVGRPKANVITACRDAIRSKNIETLTRIIKHGA